MIPVPTLPGGLFSAQRLPDLLTEAKRERLFGKIILEFNDGDVKLVRKELTYKIHHSEEDNSNVNTARRQHDQ
jgi:hypothetical protein